MKQPMVALCTGFLVALLILVSACAAAQPAHNAPATPMSRPRSSSVQGLHYARVEAPPRQIPIVSVASPTGSLLRRGELLYYDWITKGRFVERLPGKTVRWPAVVPVKRPGSLTLAASTDRLPIRGELLFYRMLGPSGIPAGEPTVYRCARAGAQSTRAASCLMSRQRVGRTARLLIRAAPNLDSGVYALVLYLSWYVPAASRSGNASLPAAVAASWGFRVSWAVG
jgi:hypothetical protein